MTTEAQRRRAWLAWITICLVWGTTYLAIKIALDTIPPFLMGGFRYMSAGALLAGFVVLNGRIMPDSAGWRRALISGALMLGLGNGGVVWAEKWVATGLTAVMVAGTPFWMVSVEAAFGGERLTRRAVIGLATGFSGIVWLVWPDLRESLADVHHTGAGFVFGVVALQIAAAGWALGSSYSRRYAMRGDAMGGAAAQMICGGAVMMAAGTLTGEWSALSFSLRSFSALLYLTIAGSLVGFACYIYALHHLSTTVVSLYTYVNPIVAVALGAFVLGEHVGWRMPSAVGVILAGMAIASSRPGPGRRGDTAPTAQTAGSGDSPAADQTNQEEHDRDHQQQMNELPDRVSAHHPQKPEHD
jgi:drug/metabolite transporter (DMT)-like permease